MRSLSFVLVLVLVLVACVACGGEQDPAATGPGRAQVRLLEYLYGGRYERAWDDLHPAHQRVAPRAQFVRCAGRVTPAGDLESIEVLEVFDDDAEIAGIQDADSRAVRLRVTSFEGESDTFVNHAVRVAERWRWVLDEDAVTAFRRNRCPR